MAREVESKTTSSNNCWLDDAFFEYCGRKLRDAQAEPTQENLETLFTAMCEHAIPAGNA